MSQQLPVPYQSHPLLHPTHHQNVFSVGYVASIIAGAGYAWEVPNFDYTRQDIYAQHQTTESYVPNIDKLSIQIKCTYAHKPNLKTGFLHFPLDRPTYNILRNINGMPHILVVVFVPDQMHGCIEFGSDHLALKYKAYWKSLRGAPDPNDPNQDDVSVPIPLCQEFNCDSLRNLMSMIATGNRP